MGKPYATMTPTERNGRNTASWKKLRTAILAASDVCWICGRHGADTVDHITPLHAGGTNSLANLRPAHGPRQPWGCPGNYGRGRRTTTPPVTRTW